MSPRKRSLSGIRASGTVHLGNYLGMIRPALARQSQFECFYFIADLHALTTNKVGSAVRSQTLDIVATFIASGFDIQNHVMYRQSDLPMVTELTWYLSCVTGMGLLEKAHAYKDAAVQNKELNHGVFAYPVLMAADILLYDADVVPVGKDQKQHVEMARDIAGSFNAIYGGTYLKLPEPAIDERVMLIPGLDGRKMSKSYDNTIPLFCSEKELRKLILSVKTDSTALEAPKALRGSLIGDLFQLFGSDSQFKDLESRLAAGGLGWGHAKQELFELINSHISEPRRQFEELRKDEATLERYLNLGAEKAYAVGEGVLNRVRNACGFRNLPFKIDL
jgi:tryptophanyl-tRNA synthetase